MSRLIKASCHEMVFGTSAQDYARWGYPAVVLLCLLAYFAGRAVFLRVTYETTTGTIVESRTRRKPPRGGRKPPSQMESLVQYEYTVGQRTYQNNDITPGRDRGCERYAERFPKGARVPVHYNPANPSEAHLVQCVGFPIVLSGMLLINLVPLVTLMIRVDDLVIRLQERTYSRSRGFRWLAKTVEGDLTEVKGLRLARKRRNKGDTFVLYLLWHNGPPVELGDRKDEAAARASLDSFAAELDVPILDTATAHQVVRCPEEAGLTLRNLALQECPPVTLPPIPPRLKIACTAGEGQIRFVLGPRLAFVWRAVYTIAIVGFLCFPGVVQNNLELCVVSFGFGLVLTSPLHVIGSAREMVTVTQSHIEVKTKRFDYAFRRPQTIPCAEIQEVTADGRAVMVRSQTKIVRIGSKACPRRDDLEWLANVLRTIVAAGAVVQA